MKERSYGQATSTVPMIGKKSSIRWWSVILQQQSGCCFAADAAFAKPEIYEYLETRQIDYAIRLPAKRSATEEDSAPADTAY